MLLFSEKGYYPIRTIYRSAGVDVFLCRRLGEEGIYTVNCVKTAEMISFCLTDGNRPYDGFIESFLWDQEYFMIYKWHGGQALREYVEAEPKEILSLMESLCQKILTCGLHPIILYQILEEDCLCIEGKEICFNCFLRFPLCWESVKETSLPERTKELLNTYIKSAIKKDKKLLLLLRRFNRELEQQFENGVFTDMLPLYLYIKKSAVAFPYKSFATLWKEYQDKLKASAERLKLYVAAAVAVIAIAVVYLNWIAKLQEGMP